MHVSLPSRLPSLLVDPTSPTQSLILVISISAIYVTYAAFTSPLGKIPGPFFARLTDLWLVHITRQRRRHVYDVELHRKYGSVVRVGPRQVLVASPAAVKMVYGTATGKALEKARWYKILSPPTADGLDLLSESDMVKYRIQRRQIGPIYSASAVADLEVPLKSILTRNIHSMRQAAGNAVDLDTWCHMLALDCLTATVFNKSTDLIVDGKDDGSIAMIVKGWEYGHWATHVPLLHRLNVWCLRFTGRDLWGKPAKSGPPIFQWAITQLHSLIDSTIASPSAISPTPSLTAKLISLHNTNPLFTVRHLTDMALTHFGAGTETIGITLSAVLYNIITQPGLQKRLHEELDDALKEGRLTCSAEGVVKIGNASKELKLLEACLRESMRLHPVIGVSFPRVVRPEGMVIDGVVIPGGTTIGANPWVIGRSKELYGPDAATFKPERWLSMSKEERIRIDTFDQTFGMGVHSCPGKHLARLILFKLLPELLMNFRWEFEDLDKEKVTECMFGVRWKDVKIAWTNRQL